MGGPLGEKKLLKKIDPSDVRILAMGLFLLFVPLVYLFLKTAAPQGGFSGTSLRESLNTGRGGFSFVQQQESAGKTGPSGSLYRAAKVDTEWKSAVEAIGNAPLQMPPMEGVSPEAKMLYEADMDPEIRQANVFLNTNRLPEAMQLYQKVLERESDNPMLKFYASSNLCTVYERMGRTDELEKEFRRMIAIMAKLPNLGFKAELSRGLESLGMVAQIMDKLRADPNTRLFVQTMLNDKGLGGKVSVDALMGEMQKSLLLIPGLGSSK